MSDLVRGFVISAGGEGKDEMTLSSNLISWVEAEQFGVEPYVHTVEKVLLVSESVKTQDWTIPPVSMKPAVYDPNTDRTEITGEPVPFIITVP